MGLLGENWLINYKPRSCFFFSMNIIDKFVDKTYVLNKAHCHDVMIGNSIL